MKSTNVRWNIIAFIVFPLTMVMAVDRGIMAIVAPIIQKQYGFTLVQMSAILTAFYWSYAPANLFAGMFAQKLGPRKGLTIASTWWSAVILATPFGIISYPILILLRILLGAGQAVDFPASVGFINRWFTKSEKSRASSIVLGGQFFGTFIGKPATAYIVVMFGWRWSFWSFGAIGLLITWIWYKYVCDNPQEHPLTNEAEKRYIAEGTDTVVVKTIPWSEWKMFLSKVQFWAIGLQYFFLLIIQGFYLTWLPTYLLATRHISIPKMGWLAAMPWIGMFGSVFINGGVQDWAYKKAKSPRTARVPFAICGFIVSSSFIYFGAFANNITVMMVCMMISMAGIGMAQVAIWSSCQDIGGPRAAVLTGWVAALGNVGSAVGPVLIAFIVTASGGNWAYGMTAAAIAGLLGAILWLFVRPDRCLIPERAAGMGAA